jgi:hypothetical protein
LPTWFTGGVFGQFLNQTGADTSTKGLQQSAGIMVNYVYELEKVEEQHEAFSKGKLTYSRQLLHT